MLGAEVKLLSAKFQGSAGAFPSRKTFRYSLLAIYCRFFRLGSSLTLSNLSTDSKSVSKKRSLPKQANTKKLRVAGCAFKEKKLTRNSQPSTRLAGFSLLLIS